MHLQTMKMIFLGTAKIHIIKLMSLICKQFKMVRNGMCLECARGYELEIAS